MYLQYKENQTIAEIKEQQKEQKIKHSIDQRIAKRTKIYKMYGSNQKRNYKSPFTVEKSESFIIAQNYKLENQINPQNRAKKRKRKKKEKGGFLGLYGFFGLYFLPTQIVFLFPPSEFELYDSARFIYIYIYFLFCRVSLLYFYFF